MSTTAPVLGNGSGITSLFAACAGSEAEGSATWLERIAPAAGRPDGPLGRYVLRERLGAGGFGVVHRAFDPLLQREVAIKLVRRRGAAHQAALQREAQALAQVEHEGVVRVFDVGRCGDHLYIVMEYVAGTTLAQCFARGLPVAQTLALLQAAGRGLAAAHAVGLVHCDFKPGNVLVGEDGSVKVADFGLARWAASEAELHDTGDDPPAASERRGLGGTPLYMAPEQHRGDAVDARGDQYAFALTLLEGLCGARPLAQGSVTALYRAKLRQQFVDPHGIVGVPEAVADAIARALSPEPSRRFADMDGLLRRLGPSRRRAPRRGLVAMAAAVAAVLLGAEPRARGGDPGCGEALQALHGHAIAQAHDSASTALPATTLPAAVVSSMDALVLRHEQHWRATLEGACEAAPRLRPEIAACLQSDADDLGAVLALAATAAPQDALSAVAELPEPQRCLAGRGAVVHAAALRDDVRAATVHALLGDTAALADDLAQLRETAADDDPLLQAQLAYWQATIARHGGETEATLAGFERAFVLARAAHADGLAHRIAVELSSHVGLLHDDVTAARRWLRTADAIAPDDLDPMRAAKRVAAEARLATHEGDHEAVVRHATAALALLDDAGLRRTPLAVRVQIMRADAELALGRLDGFEARTRALAIEVAAVAGPRSRAVGDVHRLLGSYFATVERLDDALVELEHARRSFERHGEAMLLAQVDAARAAALAVLGRLDEAVAAYHTAIDALPERAVADRGLLQLNLALAEIAAGTAGGRLDQGEADLEQAALQLRPALGDAHPWVAFAEEARADLAAARGAFAEAAPRFRSAAQGFARAFGPRHWMVASAWLDAAQAELQRGRTAAAEQDLARFDADDVPPTLAVARDHGCAALRLAQHRTALARACALASAIRLAPLPAPGTEALRARTRELLARTASRPLTR
ncbi:MAG: serine/threonine protein kinase [Nannocystaceae bacterium]|nr:serine/threonine protein kinase [Nannocystaceae bacterium]